MLRTIYCFLLPSLILHLAACGGDPISHSEPVGIELKAESGKVVGGVVTDEKNINTESGNPFGAFVSNARDALGKADPGSIEITEVTMLLGGTSTGVASIGDIFDGRVDVQFELDTSNDTLQVAHATIDSTTGAGPIPFDVDYDPATLSQANFEQLLAGSFKVIYRGPVQPDFAARNAKGDLQLTFTFEAFE
jgi:hypothetical protein